MKDLKIRALSGLLYVGLILVSLFQGPLFFHLVLGLFSVLALIEFHRLLNTSVIISLLLLLGLYSAHFFALLSPTLMLGLLYITIVSCLLLSYRLYFHFPITGGLFKHILSLGYLVSSCFFIVALYGNKKFYNPYLLLSIYSMTWVNNSAAYFVGSRFGKHPLLPTISPKKSWEGFWGGQLFVCLFAFGFYLLVPVMEVKILAALSLFIPSLATIGDLIQSQFKREAGVKDSGSLLPGHGGFYDRMDSIIYIAPFVYLLHEIIIYVS